MESNVSDLQATEAELPSFEQAFEWPQQAAREQNWPEAALRWAVLRKAYPEHPAPWIQGALAKIEAGEMEQAETLLTHAQQQFPNHPNVLTSFAAISIRKQEWVKAEEFLEQAREKYPENIQTWMKSAECAEGQGELKQAAAYFQKACECAPNRPGPFIQFAELFMRAKQWEQALKGWEALRNHFPDIAAGYLRAAEAARQLDRPKEARQLTLAHQYGADILNTIAIPIIKTHPNNTVAMQILVTY